MIPPPPLIFQMIVVVGVALSCFKVKVPFIVAIKHSSCGRKKALEWPREGEKRRYREIRREREKRADGIIVQAIGFITLELR